MRALRFVTLGGGGSELLLTSPEGEEHYVLPIDDELREALRIESRRPSPDRQAAPDPAMSEATADRSAASFVATDVTPAPISPREIQVRVRAGESPQAIADEFGMSLDRVMRFAAAVMDERIRIADEARRSRARRTVTDGEGKLLVFGEAVDERFRAHGIDPDSVSWDARRRDDGEWLVAAHWLGGEATHGAEWLFSRMARSVTPLDDTASDLLSDRPIRPVLPPEPERPSLAAAPPLAPGIVAFPPMPDAATGPLPRVDDVFDQEAAAEGPRHLPPLVPAAAALDYDEPPLPLGIADPAPAAAAGIRRNLGVSRRDETDEERAARARVPSWDDILLGIKRRD
jgi:Protein of unknown function (DUF3071)